MTDKKSNETGMPDEAGGDVLPPELEQAMLDAERIASLEAENASLKDRVLRVMADMENLRRRADREKTDAGKYAMTQFARDILSVGDNLQRATEALPDEALEDVHSAIKTLIEGVTMTERELLNVFERHGIKRIDPKGERFDPNFHQAIFEVPDKEIPSGKVVEVVQSGYVIGERVLRPAMVGVSKGGPKMPRPDKPGTEAPAAANDDARPPEGSPPGGTLDKNA